MVLCVFIKRDIRVDLVHKNDLLTYTKSTQNSAYETVCEMN